MKISGELQFIPNECKWQYEDNCLDCIHFIGLDDNNSIECNYEDNGVKEIDEVEEMTENKLSSNMSI